MASYVSGNLVTDGLVLYLDAANTKSYTSGSTIWNDLTINGINGTLINGPIFNNQNMGGIIFDGGNDYINFGNPSQLNFTGSMTCCCWFYRSNSVTTNLRLLSKGGAGASASENGFSFFGSNTSLSWSVTNNAVRTIINTGEILEINKPYYIVGIVDKNLNQSLLYLNGLFLTSSTLSNSGTMVGAATFEVGRASTLSSLNWVGGVYGVQIYDRPLSQQEITQNFNSIRGRYGI